MLLQLSHFTPFIPLRPLHPVPPTFPHLTSCPWVLHISSLPSPFPILFLPSPCLFATYHLCYLFSVSFPPFSSLPLPANNPPCDLYFFESVPVPVLCLVCCCLFLGSVIDICEFVVILLLVVLIFFFYFNKSL